ncbi:PREDICTED: uncharacterized protein LOC104820624 [Tarenaya hassleriana]|uniref:uncharacterized protein LOC104820624 n=1 Tax=Tarenaya hassleriana TaxID=28532 RepID=UPI00053C51E3|nr:PREDICTED: uncharacterized protein LOC104820624 [Tarenaya hassleriana]
MAEEFDESEVIFSHNFSDHRHREEGNSPLVLLRGRSIGEDRRRSKTTTKTALSSSLPVKIPPENVFRRYPAAAEEFSDEENSNGGGGEIVPPHVIVGRRIQGKMAFSVCTGNGRTLKGRDLSRVRNSVLRLTGFLEA